jgi:hypothetical protein
VYVPSGWQVPVYINATIPQTAEGYYRIPVVFKEQSSETEITREMTISVSITNWLFDIGMITWKKISYPILFGGYSEAVSVDNEGLKISAVNQLSIPFFGAIMLGIAFYGAYHLVAYFIKQRKRGLNKYYRWALVAAITLAIMVFMPGG